MKEANRNFDTFIEDIKAIKARPKISISEIPAPQKLAPYAFAITADLALDIDSEDDIATGRFVLLHDPDGQESWDGTFRCVTFVRSALDIEIQSDPMLPDVGWSWFIDALKNSGASYSQPSGTVTRVASASFGELSSHDESSEIEIRASWTADNPEELMSHVHAWLELMASAAGLAPLPEGVASLPQKR